MKKRSFFGGLTAVLAAIGIVKYLQSQNESQTKGPVWTLADMPDLTDKIIVVTGANSGIGYEAAKAFAQKGAQVIMACRNIQKAEAALTQLKEEISEAKVEIMQLDLASLDSIRWFTEAFKSRYDRLDILVNNAGIMMVPYGTTEDGFERQFGTNHLGHFALTGLLLEPIKASANARIVTISSSGHRMGSMDFNDLMYAEGKGYSPIRAYGRSKLANLLFTYELQRRLKAANINAVAVAAHPGSSNTNLANHLLDGVWSKMMLPFMSRMMQGADMGALPTLRAAVDPEVSGGEYYGPEGFMETTGHPVKVKSNESSHDLAAQRRLWEASQELTGITYL